MCARVCVCWCVVGVRVRVCWCVCVGCAGRVVRAWRVMCVARGLCVVGAYRVCVRVRVARCVFVVCRGDVCVSVCVGWVSVRVW